MDKIKLAQFHEISDPYDNIGCEFLKRSNNNLNHSISDVSDKDSNQSDYSCINRYTPGYSYLHIAAKNFDLASMNELIKQKVDLIKQDHKDGQTPLHIVSGRFNYRGCSEKFYDGISYESIMAYVGILKENKFVDVLLSAQVETDVTVNPKSADGTSHLHIACMYNHTKTIQLFLSVGESVDHETNDKHQWPGYTALHFAIRYSAFEAAEILLNHGADIHLKDFQGKSALHLMIERLLDIADFLAVGKRTYCPFYEQERDTLDSILKVFLKITEGEDISDDSGITLLHLLCMLKDSTLIKTCFKEDMNVNGVTKSDSKLWPGWTPLHFAACFNVETFKFLLQNGAALTIKNTKGRTPLDFCMERYSPHIVHSILSIKQEFKNISFSDGSTNLLDILLIMTNVDMFEEWLTNVVNVDISVPLDSPIWPGSNLLHLAVLNERKHLKDAKMIFEAELSKCRSGIDERLVDNWKQIMNCLLSKPHNFNANNAHGLTPLFLAFHQRRTLSVNMILDSRKNNDDLEGLPYFHIACAVGNMRVIERLKDKVVSLDEPIKRDFEWYFNGPNSELVHVSENSTPLHIAVILGHLKVVQFLIRNNAKIHCKDQRGLDPFQLAFMNADGFSSEITKVFLEEMVSSGKFVIEDNLHCLHVAAMCDDGKIIQELLQNGANSEVCFEPSEPQLQAKFAKDIGKTPLQIAVSHESERAEAALLKGGANIFAPSGKTPIKYTYYFDCDYVSKLKQKKGYFINPINETGLTMLHIACQKRNVKWVKSLLKKRADPNSRLFLSDEFYNQATPLDILAHGDHHFIKCQPSLVGIAELLIEYGADVTTMNGRGRTPLHTLYYETNKPLAIILSSPKEPRKRYVRRENCYLRRDAQAIVGMLPLIDVLSRAQKTYDVNPTDCHGLSHFHMACFTGNLEAVKGFLDAGVDVNQTYDHFTEVKLHAGYTPLHFAVNQKSSDVARLLIERGANVKAEDLRGDTPLHTALKHGFTDVQLIELILRRGGDINAKNARGTTPIEYLFMTEAFTLQQCEFMLNHGAVIDLTHDKRRGDGVLGLALKNAEPNHRQSIFSRIMNVCDIKSLIEKGFNVIDSAVNVDHEGQLTVDFYLNVIEQLIEVGCNINQKDQQGKTALHRATSLYNCEAVKALLLAGANSNVVDKNGESPIAKEVQINGYGQGRRKHETLFFLVSQIWKMVDIGLNVNKSTKTAVFEMVDKFSTSSVDRRLFSMIKIVCLHELNNKVRQTFINQLTLDKFFSESEAVMWYSRMPLAERQLIDAFFKCGDNVRRGFPKWGGFLMMQYRKAVARAKMIRPAMQVIFSAGIKLPALCLEEIAEYLNYDELKLLVCEY